MPTLRDVGQAAATDNDGLGDSPLVTPRKEPDEDEDMPKRANPSSSTSNLMQAMTQAIQNPTAVRPRPAAEEDTKKRGW